MAKQTAATSELDRLTPFVGLWNTEGKMMSSPSGQPARFKATDTYEWLPGGYFLIHRFDADMPDGNIKGIEIIGYNEEGKSFPVYSFDSTGRSSVMQARVEKDIWTFTGESIRFTGGFRHDGKAFAGIWELRSDDGASWRPWMEVALSKDE